ncbi:hypothetical protein BH23BAC2_BH23BAC2_17350 [soil metagenome]
MKELSKITSTLLFILLTGLLVVIAIISYNKIRQFNKSVDLVMDTQVVKDNIIELRSNVKDAESGQRGYLITNDSVFLQPTIGAEQRSNLVFARLDSLIGDNAGQQENLKKLKTLLDERYLLLNKSLKSFKNNQSTNLPTDSLLLESKNKMDEVRKQIALMLQTEDAVLEQRIQVKDRSATLTPIFLLLLSLFSIVALSLFFFRLQKETNSRVSTAKLVEVEAEARKKIEASEEHFRTFANSIQNLAWIANADGWIYWYNQQWYDYTGTTLEEMEGLGWEKVHHPDHIKRVVEFAKEAWKKDEAFELTFPLRRHDGEYRWFLTRAYPLKDANGNIERWIGTNTDINEQKITEQKKDEFISIASHEMKTPLTTAKGYIQLLLLSLSEENQAALYAKRASQAVEKLNDLATELLDASKIQNGQLDYNITTFDLNEMVDETIENIQHSATSHSIQKTGNCSQQITGDRGRLQQVLINLLTNAVKYSPNADKVFVKIDEQEGNVQVSVQDFGVGISGRHLDKIFDRYYRVEEHAIQFQGLGIGLYISHNIIKRHDGKMWAESEPEKGSTFYFTLPL